MSSKDKDKRSGKVLVQTKAGPQWVPDLSEKVEEKPWATLRELQKHMAISLEELRQKYSELRNAKMTTKFGQSKHALD